MGWSEKSPVADAWHRILNEMFLDTAECFIMGDKEQFQNTVLKYEGLWERLSLLCMYIPLTYKAVHNLLS